MLNETATCAAAVLATEWRTRWLPSNVPPHRFAKEDHQTVNRCCPGSCSTAECSCVVYVHNQKAGSMFLAGNGTNGALPRYFAGLTCTSHSLPYAEASAAAGTHHLHTHSADFVFTVVRDPIATAVSAFCEVDRRDPSPFHGRHSGEWLPDAREKWLGIGDHRGTQYQARYEAVGCSCATCRYAAFLDGIEAREPLSHEFFHAYPQAVKTNVRVQPRTARFDAVVKLERLEPGLRAIAARLGLPFDSGAGAARSTSSTKHTTTTEPCCPSEADVRADPQLVRRLCRMYHADFACFGYDLPPECRE